MKTNTAPPNPSLMNNSWGNNFVMGVMNGEEPAHNSNNNYADLKPMELNLSHGYIEF